MKIQDLKTLSAGLVAIMLLFAVSCDSVTGNLDSESDRPSLSYDQLSDFTMNTLSEDGDVCETAFAFGGNYATCFIGMEQLRENRWGWTNGPLTEGNYEFDIYTGAGRCDLSKGTHVGILFVDYEDGEVTVRYELFDGFFMTEVHIYVGNGELPMVQRGPRTAYTVAPGQYTHKNDNLENLTSYSQTFDASGEIFLIAHAVVCEGCVPSSIIYGIQSYVPALKGNIYTIDPLNQTETIFFNNPDNYAGAPWWYPNALALDEENRRMYFTSDKNSLWFYDMNTGLVVDADPDNYFTNDDEILGAAFGDGYYWFIVNRSGDLGKVSFDGNGKVTSVVKEEMSAGLSIGMGDIVYKDGVIYGSSGTGAPGTQTIFFTYDTTTDTDPFESYDRPGERALQLAWGLDEYGELALYGHLVTDINDVEVREWYTVDITNGVRTDLEWVSDYRYEDLASEVKLCH